MKLLFNRIYWMPVTLYWPILFVPVHLCDIFSTRLSTMTVTCKNFLRFLGQGVVPTMVLTEVYTHTHTDILKNTMPCNSVRCVQIKGPITTERGSKLDRPIKYSLMLLGKPTGKITRNEATNCTMDMRCGCVDMSTAMNIWTKITPGSFSINLHGKASKKTPNIYHQLHPIRFLHFASFFRSPFNNQYSIWRASVKFYPSALCKLCNINAKPWIYCQHWKFKLASEWTYGKRQATTF